MTGQQDKPLQGLTLVLTRQEELSLADAVFFQDLGAETLVLPCLKIEYKDLLSEPENQILLDGTDWIVFTSRNGVQAFFQDRALENDKSLVQAAIACVGPRTAKVVEEYGQACTLMPASHFSADGLLEAFRNQVEPGAKVLLIQGDRASLQLAEGLRQQGFLVSRLVSYETKKRQLKVETVPDGSVVLFYSGSAVESFASQIFQGAYEVACIGLETAKVVQCSLGREDIILAKEHTRNGLKDALIQWHTKV